MTQGFRSSACPKLIYVVLRWFSIEHLRDQTKCPHQLLQAIVNKNELFGKILYVFYFFSTWQFVTILESVLAKLSRYDEGTLFSSFLSFTVSEHSFGLYCADPNHLQVLITALQIKASIIPPMGFATARTCKGAYIILFNGPYSIYTEMRNNICRL